MGEVDNIVGDEALALACERVQRDPNPAFVKDSELRYVAVNASYAELWDCPPESLVGQQSHQHFDSVEQNDRDEKERRSLVFGKDQAALFAHPLKGGRYRIRIQRQRQTSGKTFIVGHFEPIAGVRFETRQILETGPVTAQAKSQDNVCHGPETVTQGFDKVMSAAAKAAGRPIGKPDLDETAIAKIGHHFDTAGQSTVTQTPDLQQQALNSVDAANQEADTSLLNRFNEIFDCLDVGIVLYDPNDVLLYVNPAMDSITAPDYMMPVGKTLRSILELTCHISAEDDPEARLAWVEKRLAAHRDYGKATVEQLKNGRWLRIVNRRLDEGYLLGLRVDVTELKEREFALKTQASENEMFRAILDEMPVSSFVKDEDFRYTYVNRAHGDLTGLSRADVVGKDDFTLFGEQGQALRDVDTRVMSGREIIESEVELTRSDGELLVLIDRKVGITDPAGRKHLLGTTLDVSEIKRREDEIFETRRLAELNRSDLESVIDAMHMGVVVVDKNDKIELVNDAFFRIWRIKAKDSYIGAAFRELMDVNRHKGVYDVADEDFDAYVETRLEEIRRGYVEPREFRRADGRTVIYSVRALSEGKRMVSYFDISELKQREHELDLVRSEIEHASELLRGATSAMAQGLLVTHDERIEFFNAAFIDMLDVPVEVVEPGKTMEGYLDFCQSRGDYGTEEKASITRSNIKAGHKSIVAHTLERQVAGGRWARIDANPAANDRMIITYTDITDAKMREAELKDLLEKAKMADRAKSEFLANMSHEIRTPMNGVLGMAELLSRSELDTRQRTFTDIIVKSGNALLTIINDILDFSKIDAGQLVLDAAPFDLRETVEDVATLISSRAADKDIELIVRIDPELPARVIGDMGRIRQIITNLAGNAIKFTEAGHVLIEVTGSVNAAGLLDLKLQVKDTGIGIPQEKLEAVFDKFSQVDNSSTRRHEGTGLGLAITSRLVSLMDGQVRAESAPDEGSVFTVEISMSLDHDAAPVRSAPIDVSGARILVIDDNPVNRAILKEQLSAWGFDACAAVSGSEGLDVLEAANRFGVPVDAIILDYHMPDMDGVMTARAIRKAHGLDKPSIIMLTSMDIKSSDADIRQGLVQSTLMKPARSSLLLQTIVEVLQAAAQSSGETRNQQSGPYPRPIKPTLVPLAALDNPKLEVASAAPDSNSQSPGPASPHSKIDLLVAEDNEVNQIVFTQILDGLGVRYKIAEDGGRAFDMWKSLRPALVLMDVSMPVMNGHQATEAIRKAETADPSLGRTPVVGVTAHALTGDKERCLEAGMDDYMSKPISPEKLEAKIREWLPEEIAARITVG
ncbi:PAS domain S-box [Hoeflea sp. IMCC20628]|uniref:PAS-domain containing protein n=1 Tax=Hoeflea sp. IMCC20628 TaxID=1620421 RepID=UPI00063BEFC9|nr:PAS-domain containing protein [Hoeflea sp. IMCC20628]AKI01579.1 PAS domain S-box [Hoeflea sp. IMCC20628]